MTSGPNAGNGRPAAAPDAIERLIAPSVEAMGYVVVRVNISGGPVVQIMVERQDGRAMTVDDCADISRTVSALLDVEDPIAGAYRLEISSPGIDRPLVKAQDFARFAGHVARVELAQPIDGRKRFQGRLKGVEADAVRLTLEDGSEVALPLSAVARAKLVLTEELLKAYATH